jgi:hypothetical protein
MFVQQKATQISHVYVLAIGHAMGKKEKEKEKEPSHGSMPPPYLYYIFNVR